MPRCSLISLYKDEPPGRPRRPWLKAALMLFHFSPITSRTSPDFTDGHSPPGLLLSKVIRWLDQRWDISERTPHRKAKVNLTLGSLLIDGTNCIQGVGFAFHPKISPSQNLVTFRTGVGPSRLYIQDGHFSAGEPISGRFLAPHWPPKFLNP